MQDPVLNRRLKNLRKLMEYWQDFHHYIQQGLAEKQFNDKDEANFLTLKSRIAILHDSLIESIEHTRESAATAQSIITVVENCILLSRISKMSPPELKRMEIEWHEGYLLVNDTIGILEEKVEKLSRINPLHHFLSKTGVSAWWTLQNAAGQLWFKVTAVLLAIVIGLVILPMFGVFNYDFLDNYPATKPHYRNIRNVLRGSMMKNLKYIDLNNYFEVGRGEMPPSYEGGQADANTAESIVTALNTTNEAFAEIKLGDKIRGAETFQPYIFSGQGKTAVLGYALFETTAQAVDLMMEIGAAKNRLGSDSEVDLVFGRDQNVIWFVSAENSSVRTQFAGAHER